ncbi:MAG: NgoFVII family restriction endonuclease, partial [Synergistaceae bacterium]|nr:NgoFVII family restriction endonuclease [Synergistaceae bacterium]
AYIPVPADIGRTDFFPDVGIHFSVTTDDGKILILSRGQDGGKGMSTPQNNSLLGEYLRNRLGLANGARVDKEDFERYGRTDITFYKLDDEQYFMDFSQPEVNTGNVDAPL